MAGRVKGLEPWAKAMLKAVDDKTIHEYMRDHHSREIVIGIVKVARSGVGPYNAPYTQYSDRYNAQLERQGKKGKPWLVGAQHKGNSKDSMTYYGGDEQGAEHGHFTFEVKPDGAAIIGWDGKDNDQDTYGRVHQGTEHGGQDHTKGHVPPRPWMHLMSTGAAMAVIAAYKATFRAIAAKYHARSL